METKNRFVFFYYDINPFNKLLSSFDHELE